MNSLVLKRFNPFFHVFLKSLYIFKSSFKIHEYSQKINIFPNIMKDIKDYILSCKTYERKKLKMKKQKFWKKWRLRRGTRKKNVRRL